MHIICTADAFRVGGRETYMGTYLRALRAAGVRTTLIARAVRRENPELRAFDEVIEVPQAGDDAVAVSNWIEAGRRAAGGGSPVLWAHHFDVHMCWFVSRALGIPMLTTFHGPLLGSADGEAGAQALGIALGLTRSDGVSGVSKEVVQQIAAFRGGRETALLPNVVENHGRVQSPLPRRRTMVLATRTEKLGHLRCALEVFAASRGRDLVDEFEIILPEAVGAMSEGSPRTRREEAARVARVFGRRWLLTSGAAVIQAALATRFPDAQFSVAERVARATAVLGMGRSLLEGAAARRPCILIGYQNAHGLLTNERFEVFARTNFSGRGIPVVGSAGSALELEERLGDALDGSRFASKALDIEVWAPLALEALEKVRQMVVPGDERDFVRGVVPSLPANRGEMGAERLLRTVLARYEGELRSAFEALLAGRHSRNSAVLQLGA
jgi:hypothetical protein